MGLGKKVLVLSMLAVAAVGAGAVPAAGAAPYCGIRWGSLPKTSEARTTEEIVAGRVGHHACFDRLVFEVDGPVTPGYRVSYVDEVLSEGQGTPVTVGGGARLRFTVLAPTFGPLGEAHAVFFDTPDFPTLKQVAGGGSFEGQTTFAVGVRARLPFTVTTLPGPGSHSRLVLDIAHHW